jgi:hypothetical protein
VRQATAIHRTECLALALLLFGWLLHVAVDRLLGFGLRGDDGGQALF